MLKEDRSVLGEATLDLEVTPSTPEKNLSFDMTREVDENGQLVIASTEHAQESDRSDSESNGEVMRGEAPSRGFPILPVVLSGLTISRVSW